MVANNKKGTLGIRKLHALLTPRDQLILDSVAAHKFLTTKQIYALHFHTHASYVSGIRACTRVLNRLRDHRLLYRLERPVGGHRGGSNSFVWGLDAAGDRLIKSTLGPDHVTRSRAFEPTTLFLAHTLAIAEVRITLEELARAGRIELLSVTTEPANWRSFTSASGTAQILKPDLHAVTASDQFEDHWFIELDRGTESLPTLLHKCHLYQGYHDAGLEQTRNGVFPSVLWLMPPGTRSARLTTAIAADGKLDSRLFRVRTVDGLPETIAALPVSTEPIDEKGGTPEPLKS
jgi:hypothetical protein